MALHVEFGWQRRRAAATRCRCSASIAFVRQSFLDAQHQQLAQQRYERSKTGGARPIYDPSLDALQPALARRLPVAFEADSAREILRSLDMAKEFKLDPVITGGARGRPGRRRSEGANARVIYSLNYPTRSRALAPDADEPLRDAPDARANAPKIPAALEKAGVLFAFSSAGSASRATSSATRRAPSRTGCPPTPRCAR